MSVHAVHFEPLQGENIFEISRRHDIHKMKWLLQHNYPLIRISARSITHFQSRSWQTWMQFAFKTHVAPLASRPRAERMLIVLED